MDKSTYLIPLVILGCILYLYFFRQEEVESTEVVKVVETKVDTPVDIVEVPKKEDGYLTEWNGWGSCSKECGGGTMERNREYIPAKYGGIDLSEAERIKLIENRNCNETPCPENGYYTTWGNWSNCDKECGCGNQGRIRTYIPATNGGVDLVDRNILTENQSCNTSPCSVKHNIVLKDGERVDNSTFMFLSPNGLHMIRWNGGLWFVLYTSKDGSWIPSGTMSITSTNTAKSVVAGSTNLALVSTSWTAKVFAVSDRPVLYSAITDDGDWVFVRDDGSTSPILKNDQNINITW
jgi:hypothetical protein